MIATDREIIKAIIDGKDGEVVGSLYESILPNVRKYVMSNNGSAEDAFDIFQDALIVFFKLVVSRKFDADKYKIHGFIYTVTKNLWINKTKKQARALRWEKTNVHETREEPFLDLLISEEKKRLLESVFSTLGDKCVEILTLSIYQRLSMKEIAAKVGLPSEDAAKVKTYRCRKMLSEKVKADKHLLEQLRY